MSLLKYGLFALCALAMPLHAADVPSKTTGWKNTVKSTGKYLFIAAWAAKGAHKYLISTDWHMTHALKSAASDALTAGKNCILAPAESVSTIMHMVLPTTSDWTVKEEALRLGAMGLAIGAGIGMSYLTDKIDESGNDALGAIKNHYDTALKDGFHCYKQHYQDKRISNPVAQLAVASLIMGAVPVVIDSVVASERPVVLALEATIALGATCFFTQSYLCKKHHNRSSALAESCD